MLPEFASNSVDSTWVWQGQIFQKTRIHNLKWGILFQKMLLWKIWGKTVLISNYSGKLLFEGGGAFLTFRIWRVKNPPRLWLLHTFPVGIQLGSIDRLKPVFCLETPVKKWLLEGKNCAYFKMVLVRPEHRRYLQGARWRLPWNVSGMEISITWVTH